jgi:hypothetical protein
MLGFPILQLSNGEFLKVRGKVSFKKEELKRGVDWKIKHYLFRKNFKMLKNVKVGGVE